MYINVQKEAQMISTAFTDFRKKTASFLDKVENGETVVITRHGRPIAEVVPPSSVVFQRSWKRPALRMKLKGVSISKEVLEERAKNRA
jgi:prevent-host-death family protein